MAHSETKIIHMLEAIADQLVCLERRLNDMPTRADFDAAKAAVLTAIADAATRVAADIQALKDALANGTPVTAQDLTDLQADVTALGQIDPAAVPVPVSHK